jgi:hypothetical protein
MQRLRILGLLVTLVISSPIAAFAQGATGNWEFAVTLPQGPSTLTMTLTQTGGAVTGTMSSPFGSAPVTGTVSGSDVTLSAELNVGGRSIPLAFKGKVEADAFSGSMQIAATGESPFTGKRAKAGATAAPAAATPMTPPPGSTGAGIAVASPTYVSIPLEITVDRPAAEVWKRVGKWCDVGEWLQIPCTITWGKDGELGAIRSVASEILVAKTELSYTYTQPARDGRPFNQYHGTLEARPLTATTTKLVYTLFFDNSMLADAPARDRDIAAKTTMFSTALKNMKILAEGGKLPPRGVKPGI